MTKKIEAYIRPEKLQDVKNALHKVGIVGMTVIEVRGHGRQGGVKLVGRSEAYIVDLLDRIQLGIVVSDHNVEKTIDTICEAAHTGDTGDGIIFISPIDDVVRIRTKERGTLALSYEDDIDARQKSGKK